ncbi:hypothetical protein H0H87_011504 [Tephrocybe sp. NHM501043]|nr:hypothetical protein H0H87_011504 [Tephrocybe sp. NHM501043]
MSSTFPIISINLPSIHSPIGNLEDKVLDYLFLVICCSEGASLNNPKILSHVCGHWRRIAIREPKLWTEISVHEELKRIPPTVREKQKKPRFLATLDRVEAFLRRSQDNLPLDVAINLTILPDNGDHIVSALRSNFRLHTRMLSQLLSPYLGRLRCLTIVVNEYPCLLDLQVHFSPAPPMPYLCALDIHAFGDSHPCLDEEVVALPLGYSHAASPCAVQDYCPRLTYASLTGVPVNFQRFAPRNLTELSLARIPCVPALTWHEFREILEANEATLEVLHLSSVSLPLMHAFLPITLRNLSSLLLTYAKPEQLLCLIEMLHVPNLEYLSIIDDHRAAGFPLSYGVPCSQGFFSVLSGLIDNFPLSSIRELELAHVWFFPGRHEDAGGHVINACHLDIRATAFDFFSALESLQVLHLVSPTTMPLDILNYVPPPPTSHRTFPLPPLPNLQELRLSEFNKHVVRDFLLTRTCIYPRNLETIHLEMPSNWAGDIYLDVQPFCKTPEIELVPRVGKRMFTVLNKPPAYWMSQFPPRRILDPHHMW